jgi:hypothetical protein
VAPRVTIDGVDVARTDAGWRVRWRIASDPPVRLTHVAAPHARFRAADRDLDVETPAELALDVVTDATAANEVENAFVIVTAASGDRDWRILARLRVRVGADGVPRPTTERIDVQEVGFSGQG